MSGRSAAGRGSLALTVAEPGGLVVDLHGDLGERVRVLAVVVCAKQQFRRSGQDYPHVGRGTAPVTQVVGVQRLRWGHRSGHVRLPCPIAADGFADGFTNLRSLRITTPSPSGVIPCRRVVRRGRTHYGSRVRSLYITLRGSSCRRSAATEGFGLRRGSPRQAAVTATLRCR